MAENLAERLLPFREYKKDIERGFLLEDHLYQKLKTSLIVRNYDLFEESSPKKGGNIYVKDDIINSKIFIDFDITSMTHGFSYLTTNNVSNFIEAYKSRQKAEKERIKCSDERGMLNGMLISIPLQFPVFIGVHTSNFHPGTYLVPLLIGSILGVYYNRKNLPNLKKNEGLAIKDLWRESKGITHGWSALEKALK